MGGEEQAQGQRALVGKGGGRLHHALDRGLSVGAVSLTSLAFGRSHAWVGLQANPRGFADKPSSRPDPDDRPPAAPRRLQVHNLTDVPSNVRELLRGSDSGPSASRRPKEAAKAKPIKPGPVSRDEARLQAAYLGRGGHKPEAK